MKRYASHFLYASHCGFLKQQVVELEDGYVRNYFPLSEELENVEWFPGVILLLSESEASCLGNAPLTVQQYTTLFARRTTVCPTSSPICLIPFLLYPFDFTEMKPVAETRHRRLQ